MHQRVSNVLFLCTANSARSILAEAVLNRLGGDRFRGFSAGSVPSGRIHVLAAGLLKAQGYPTQRLRSKSWQEFSGPDAPPMDFIFTVCDRSAGEACPVWPGHPVSAHWGLPDPAAVRGTRAEQERAFARTLRLLHRRIAGFVNLPLAALDQDGLRAALERIGRIDEAPADTGDDGS